MKNHEGEAIYRRAILGYLTAIVLLTLAGVVNRLTPMFRVSFLGCRHFLWRDFMAAFVLAPAMSVVLYLLKVRMEPRNRGGAVVLLAFLLWMAASMGVHEVTNTLSAAARRLPDDVAAAIVFLDDRFSHYTFFISFAGITLSLIAGQLRAPLESNPSAGYLALLLLYAVVMSGLIFANMAFEPTRVDLAVGLTVWVAGTSMWRRRFPLRRVPVVFCFLWAYGLGFISAILYKLAHGTL